MAGCVAELTAAPLARKKRELEKRLSLLLAAATDCDLARGLQAKSPALQSSCSPFAISPARSKPPPIAIAPYGRLRPKPTLRTTIDAARLKGANRFDVILAAIG